MCLSSGSKEKGVANTCPIVAVKVTNPTNGKVEKTYAMLDGGSEFSIIDQSLAKSLGVETAKELMTITTLNSTTQKDRQVCHATLSSMD
jgi:hypothetical protein